MVIKESFNWNANRKDNTDYMSSDFYITSND